MMRTLVLTTIRPRTIRVLPVRRLKTAITASPLGCTDTSIAARRQGKKATEGNNIHGRFYQFNTGSPGKSRPSPDDQIHQFIQGEDSPHDKQIIEMSRQRPVSFQEIEDLLASIEKERKEVLGIHTFIELVKACIHIRSFEAAEAAERFTFEWMMKFYLQGQLGKADLRNIFGMAMQAWVKSGYLSSGKRAERQLDVMEDLARKELIPFAVDAPKYNTVMRAYAMYGDFDNTKKVFDRCKQAFDQGNESARPDAKTWNALLDACAKSSQRQRAEFWLDEMNNDYMGGNTAAQPNVASFNSVMNAYAMDGDDKNAQRIFNMCRLAFDQGNETARPNGYSWSTLIDAYAKSGNPEAWKNAENAFGELQKNYREGVLKEPPNAVIYGAIINSCAKSKQLLRAAFWLEEMCRDYQSGNTWARPSIGVFRTVWNAWDKEGTLDSQKREAIINRMEELGLAVGDSTRTTRADTVVHPQLTNKTRNPKVSHDHEILELMKALPESFQKIEQKLAFIEKETNASLSGQTFFSLVKACIHIGDMEGAEIAEKLVSEWMIRFYQQNRLEKPPISNITDMAVKVWGASGHPGAAMKAEQMLDKMEGLSRQEIIQFDIHTTTYNTVIKAYAKEGDADKALAVFERCTRAFEQGNEKARPDVSSWGFLLDAFAKSGYPGRMAEGLIIKMQKSHQSGKLTAGPTTGIYRAVIWACAKSDQLERAEYWLEELIRDYNGSGNKSVQPDVKSFTNVLGMYAINKLGTVESARRAESILSHMAEFAKTGVLRHGPSRGSYEIVIKAYAKQGRPREAAKVLNQQYADFMAGNKRCRLDMGCFKAIIDGWTKTNESISGEQAQYTLDQAITFYMRGTVREGPDPGIYHAVIKARLMLGDYEKATQVFDRLLEDHKNGIKSAQPTREVFLSLVETYIAAKLPDAGKRAHRLLEAMVGLEVKVGVPGTKQYDDVLFALRECWKISLEHGTDPKAAEARIKELSNLMSPTGPSN